MSVGADLTAAGIVDAIRIRRTSAHDVVTGVLDRIARRDRMLNCFTRVLAEIASGIGDSMWVASVSPLIEMSRIIAQLDAFRTCTLSPCFL